MDTRIIVALITAIITVTAGVAILLWHRLLDVALNSLLPWCDDNLPTLAPIVRGAFTVLDKAGVPTRRALKQSWQKVREYLLKQVVQIERQSSDTWVQQVTSWLVNVLDSGESTRKVRKIVVEEDIDYFDLPEEVREEYIKKERKTADFDITKMRDQELEEEDVENDDGMSMEN
ncbi:MAG: hypothetical protein ACM65K_06615 [Microcoleus sp.]